jgi:hypothetical protein
MVEASQDFRPTTLPSVTTGHALDVTGLFQDHGNHYPQDLWFFFVTERKHDISELLFVFV